VAVVQLIVVGVLGQMDVFTLGPAHAVLTLGSGVVTALPLMLFAAGTRRIPLSWVGLIQYFSPFASFLLGIFVFHEAMSTGRWIGFGIIWLAIVLLSIDVLINRRSRSRLLEAEATAIGG
jgi:chloramphenicol-sensitive protein RarD